MMVAIDGTVVAVANPSIQSHLNASLADIQWVTNGYLLAIAITLITIGKIGDRFGHKKVFLTGIVGFAATSAAVGLSGDIAGSIELVIAFRVLQGVFGAMLQPTALALLRDTFPLEKLNGAIGVWGAVIGASTAGGPIVGGLLVQHLNWESCFYINVPVGVIALALSLFALRETKPSPAARSFDIVGIVTLTAFLFLLVWALIKGGSYGWGSGREIAFFVGAVVALILFIVRESRAEEPLVPLRLFRSVPFSAGTVLVLALMFSMFGALFFMTFFMQNVHGLDPVGTGIRLLPMTGMLIVGAPLSGAVITKTGPRAPMVVGMVLAAIALFGLSRIGVTSNLNDTILWFALLGLGLSPVMVGSTEVIVGNAPLELAGVAGGLQTTAMQVGGTIGTAVLGAVMSSQVTSLLPTRWAAAHLPALHPAQLAGLVSATEVGVAPPAQKGVPAQVTSAMADVVHGVFTSGMSAGFVTAFGVAVAGALIAFFTRRGIVDGPMAVDSPALADAQAVADAPAMADASAMNDLVALDEPATPTAGELHLSGPALSRASGGTPEWFAPYLVAEPQASVLRLWDVVIVPDLLQTEAYARAILSGYGHTPERLGDLLAARMERQRVLDQARVISVLDQRVFRDCIGTPATMAEQCAHLVSLAESGKIRLHVVPEGANTGTWAGFSIASRGGAAIVSLTNGTLGVTSTTAEQIDDSVDAWDRVMGSAMPPAGSVEFVRQWETTWKERI
jgi:EmrB/QacA subfamily drug resistance transporter